MMSGFDQNVKISTSFKDLKDLKVFRMEERKNRKKQLR